MTHTHTKNEDNPTWSPGEHWLSWHGMTLMHANFCVQLLTVIGEMHANSSSRLCQYAAWSAEVLCVNLCMCRSSS